MRDFMPETMGARNRVISVVETVFRKYGYEPLETPALESMDVLNMKVGEDTGKQIYRVEDGKLGMRFDLTVPLARLVAGNPSIPKPFKRYCIGKVWRREEPQKGRFREFLQADVDVVGSPRMECEAELIACACECLKELGFSDFTVRINNRKIMDAIVKKLGVKAQPEAVFRALDKLGKIGEGGVEQELEGIGVGKKEKDELIGFVSEKGSDEQITTKMEKYSAEGAGELKEILRLCGIYGVGNVSVDMSLMRGLDYYTGPVFEISAGEGVGSIAGGGRYDNLISSYGGGEVPAVGISLGIERIMALLEGKGGKGASLDVYVAAVKPEFYGKSVEAAKKLRGEGLSIQVDVMGRNLRKQLEYANSKGVRFAAIIGQKEAEAGKVTLRNLANGDEKLVSIQEAAKIVRG